MIHLLIARFYSAIISGDQQRNTTRPCTASPCGPNTLCDTYTDQVAVCGGCDSVNNGNDPLCHPECLSNTDCQFNQACIGWKCADPCLGSCGINANCQVILHAPVCSCPIGLYGNPYDSCSPQIIGDYIYYLSILIEYFSRFLLTNKYQLQRIKIHVVQHNAERMQYARREMVPLPANACQITSEIHSWRVTWSAFRILTAV